MPMGPKGFTAGELHECWLWQMSCDRAGYGQAWDRKRKRLGKAHRVVYESLTGIPLPGRESGMELHHKCGVRRCVNPDHLQLITIQENRRLRHKPVWPAPLHGRVSTYTNHKCRCQECREAWAAYYRRRRKL